MNEATLKNADPTTTSSNQLNSPQLDPKTAKPTRRAVTDAKQAYGICKSIRDRALNYRIKTAGEVNRRYNADNPYDPEILKRTGQGHRNNFSTNFLGSILDRVIPQLVNPLNKAPLLVHGALPDGHPDGAKKSRTFNEKITACIRAWPEWKDFVNGLAQDIVTFGNSAPSRIDEDWRPRLWRYDEAYLPEGTGQHADKVQIAPYVQKVLMHEFLALVADPEIAKKAGYDIAGCVKTANAATGNQQSGREFTDMEREDSVRELAEMSYSYGGDSQTKTINLFHLLVRDYTGEVDLWTVSQDDGTLIRNVQGLHKQMKDCVTLFTMQTGNRKFYGSKGLGRLLANLHTAIERGRCMGADKQQFSGLPIILTDDPAGTQLKVRFPFMTLPTGATLSQEAVVFDYKGFLEMDNKLVQIAESIAGAFIPPNVDNEKGSNTKIEAAQKAERDIAVRQGVLVRFTGQATELCDMMKRAICSPLNIREAFRAWEQNKAKRASGVKVVVRSVWKWLKESFGNRPEIQPEADSGVGDPEAVSVLVEMLEAGIMPDEIAALALTLSTENNAEAGQERDNQVLQYISLNKTSPYIDQQKAAKTEAELVCGKDIAQELLIPADDPNIKNAAIRQQTIESSEMLDGNAMPVVGSDAHALHRQNLAGTLDGIVTGLQQTPTAEMVQAASLMCNHYMEHLGADVALQANPAQKQKEEGAIKEYMGIVKKADAALKVAAELQARHGIPGQPGAQPPPNPEQAAQEHQQTRDTIMAKHEVDMRAREADQRDRELALKESEHAHKKEVDAVQLQQANVGMLASAAADAQKADLEHAKLDATKEVAKAAAKAAPKAE